MGLADYLNLLHGIAYRQFMFLYVLSINPFIFKLFELRHFILFGIGTVLSLFSHRAIIPFMLLILLDLDYSKMDKPMRQKMLLIFMVASAIFLLFGGSW